MEIEMLREDRKRKIDYAEILLIKQLKSVYIKTRNGVPTLREVVIQSIAKNLEYWVKPQIVTDNLEIKDKHNASPFECLSAKDTLAIWHTANAIKYNEKCGLNLFLHERQTKFCFSFVSPQYRVDAFNYVIRNCKGIKELLISCPNENVNEKLMQFRKTTLDEFDDSEKTWSGYSFLKSLSLNFKSLTLLEIHCKKISKQSYKLLTELKKLQVMSLVQAIELHPPTFTKILTSLKLLKSVSLSKIPMKFQLIDATSRFQNILTLDVASSHITDKGLELVVKVNMNITSLSIEFCESLTTECFTIISTLQQLAYLNASCVPSGYNPVNEDGHFNRFLLKQGPKLKFLNLSFYEYIDTWFLAKCCPNLESLNLFCCYEISFSWINQSDLTKDSSIYDHLIPFNRNNYSLFEICHQLNTFVFTSTDDKDQLEMIFRGNSKVLRNLQIDFYEETEANMSVGKFFNTFHFENLEKLKLVVEYNVPKEDIFIILKQHIHLKRLDLEQCPTSVEDIEDIKYVLQQSKSEIDICFNPPGYYES